MRPFETVYEAFQQAVANHRDGACICLTPMAGRAYHPEGCEWSYGEIAEKVETTRAAYSQAGYGPGHRIALLLDSRPEIVWHWLALNALGASIVPLNPDYRAPELEYVLTHAEVDAVIVLADRRQELEQAFGMMPSPPPSVLLPEFLTHLTSARRPAPNVAAPPGRHTETALLYTSGTTAAPKACIITNDYCIAAGERYLGAGGMLKIRYGNDRLFNPLPLFYVNSLVITNMTMILSAGCMIYPDRFHPTTWWRDVAWSRATIIQYLGMVLPALLNQAPTPEERAHQVRFGVGAGVDPTRHAEFEQRFGFPIFEVWGMTEVAIASIASHEPRHIETRSIGRPLAGIQFRVVDDEGRDVPFEEPGELLVRADGEPRHRGLFAGYYKASDITEESWRGDWFHTGDLVLKRADGSFCFVDRAKDIIRRSGQNISASEVEAVIRAHPVIRMAAALPIADAIREEEVMACLVLRDGAPRSVETAQALVTWCLERLAYFKVPGWICFRDDLPVTHTQKIRKRDIFASGVDPREDPHSIDCRALKKAGPRHRPGPTISTGLKPND